MGKKKTKSTKKQDASNSFVGAGIGRGAADVQVTDKHHNMDTPCSSLVRNVVLDIFPSVADAEKEEGSAEAESDVNDQFERMKGIGERHQKRGEALWADDDLIETSYIKKKVDKGKGPNKAGIEDAKVQENKEQPLLGYMIHHYLVQQRKQAREQLSRAVQEKNQANEQPIQRNDKICPDAGALTNEDNADSTMTDSNSNPQAESLASKKKKKKRKKKTSEPADDQEEGSDGEEEALANSLQQKAKKSTDAAFRSAEKIDRENHVHSSSLKSNGKEGDPYVSSFDCFLDTIIDSPTNIVERPNRDIDSFAKYLQQKYESFLAKQQSKKRDKKSKQQQSSSSDSSAELMAFLPTVSLDELRRLSSHIECRTCSTSVTSNLRAITKDLSYRATWGVGSGCDFGSGDLDQPDRVPFVLDDQSTTFKKKGPRQCVSVPISGEEESAFDYVALEDDLDLEEGHSAGKDKECISNSQRFRLELQLVQIGEQNYLQIKPMSEGQKSIYPLSTDEIVELIKSVILPCGLEQYESEPETQLLSDDDFESIMNSSFELCTSHRKKFYEIHNLMSQMNGELQKASATNNRSQFDSSTTTALNSCDDFCETILKFVGTFLIGITRLTCLAGWSSQYGPYLMECMEKCWNEYNVTLDSLVEPTMLFRGRCCGISNRPGQVPALWGNKMVRDAFFKYVSSKVELIEKLVSYLDQTLIDPNYKSYHGNMHQAVSPLARLCILNEYLSFLTMSRDSSSRSDLSLFPSEIDESKFTQLLAARIRLSQKGIRKIRVDAIRSLERQNYSEVSELYTSIGEVTIPKLTSQIHNLAPDYIKQYYARYTSEHLKARQDLSLNPEEITPVVAASLLNSSRLLTMQWIYLLCLRQSISPVDFIIPSLLNDWMENLSGSDISPIKRHSGSFKCDGAGGKRRVSGVLAALLYRWLEVRCSEWHAEVTQNELLESVDVEEPAVKEGETKSGKKKKSTKKKDGAGDKSKVKQPIANQSLSPQIETSSDKIVEAGDAPSAVENVEANEADLQSNESRAVGESSDRAEVTRIIIDAGSTTTSIDNAKPDDPKLTIRTSDIQQTVKQHSPSSTDEVKSGKNKKIKKIAVSADESIEVKKDNAADLLTELKDNNGSVPMEKASSVQPAAFDTNSNNKNAGRTSKDSNALSVETDAGTNSKTTSVLPAAVKSGKPIKPRQNKQESTEKVAKSQSLQQKPNQTAEDKLESTSADGIETAKLSNNGAEAINPGRTKTKFVTKSVKSTNKESFESNLVSADEVIRAGLQPRVGVLDNGKIISAEDFLVGRMEVILAEINAIKSRYTLHL